MKKSKKSSSRKGKTSRSSSSHRGAKRTSRSSSTGSGMGPATGRWDERETDLA